MASLSLDDVVAGYGLGDILRGVHLSVAEGTITCVIGPNGAGKSTVLKAVSGLLRPSRGTISVDGETISGRSPREVLDRGVVHVPQERSLFPLMTVWDNVLMGGYVLKGRSAAHRKILEIADRFPMVHARRHTHAGSLSGGEQKVIEIARAMMLDPRIVLMDEPSMGLDPKARRVVFQAIRDLNDSGTTVLLVEQNARSGLAIAHRGAVMESGVVRLEGVAAELLNDPDVARLYLGSAVRSMD